MGLVCVLGTKGCVVASNGFAPPPPFPRSNSRVSERARVRDMRTFSPPPPPAEARGGTRTGWPTQRRGGRATIWGREGGVLPD